MALRNLMRRWNLTFTSISWLGPHKRSGACLGPSERSAIEKFGETRRASRRDRVPSNSATAKL